MNDGLCFEKSWLNESGFAWPANISNKELKSLAKRIRPVARFLKNEENELYEEEGGNIGDLYFVETPKTLRDLRGIAVNWNPKPLEPTNNLMELATILTYHTMGVLLKASVAEVLSQIPEVYLDRAVAFEVVHKFPTPLVIIGMNSYHKTQTRLYGIKG